ncbi:MAG: hypothetical protein VX185_14590 [Pseudomonadota bacterium]|nr:hypothetical protein [Gammaproteobacteria bacterium]MEC8011980.1 hypothetical protein [Pseudomonadota bacterium]|tara:strand:+ start:175 stop:357 length:183 start_codon:yes stop_codon:yes gene_type:complete
MTLRIEMSGNDAKDVDFMQYATYEAARETFSESITAIDMHAGIMAAKTIGQAISQDAQKG